MLRLQLKSNDSAEPPKPKLPSEIGFVSGTLLINILSDIWTNAASINKIKGYEKGAEREETFRAKSLLKWNSHWSKQQNEHYWKVLAS